MNDADILFLVDRLERCLLGKEEFHHRDHLAVAVVYLYDSDLETAMDRMRASLKRFAAHHGVNGLYHETLDAFLATASRTNGWIAAVSGGVSTENSGQLGDKNLAFEYYSREIIESKEQNKLGCSRIDNYESR